MWASLGSLVDFFHALAMASWVAGLPLLVWHRWPRLTRAYGIYAVSFIVLSQVSQMVLGECFLTTLARVCWDRADGAASSSEWFTVRIAHAVFRMTPSHRAISLISEALILITAGGVLFSLKRAHGAPQPR